MQVQGLSSARRGQNHKMAQVADFGAPSFKRPSFKHYAACAALTVVMAVSSAYAAEAPAAQSSANPPAKSAFGPTAVGQKAANQRAE